MSTTRTQSQHNARTAERTKASFALLGAVLAGHIPMIASSIGSIRNPESNRFGSYDVEPLTIKEYALFESNDLIGVIDTDKFNGILTSMKDINERGAFDYSNTLIGVRYSNDSVMYFTLDEALVKFL